MSNFHLHLLGRVQGVGFRPHVWRMAREMGLKGWVNNAADGVHVELHCKETDARAFLQALLDAPPPLAKITTYYFSEIPDKVYPDFSIIHSQTGAAPQLLLAPDFALCPDCRQEMKTPGNRRYQYPFITCTYCGPRYAIANTLPYDRETTTMQPFAMCPDCQAEYDNPADRRYYSQTNSCPACGIALSLSDKQGNVLAATQAAILDLCQEALQDGKIIAVKGIGGYLLLCDACDVATVQLLRTRKHRPHKPFAVLYPDLQRAAADVTISPEARAALEGPVAPIVLLPVKSSPQSGIAMEAVAPGLGHLGVLLPYAPLLELLSENFGKPLVATSANFSGSPIVRDEQAALALLGDIADLFLHHNRLIAQAQDDSVLRFSARHALPVWLRRARGLAPSLELPLHVQSEEILLCTGADMKGAFSWSQNGCLYVSPYLGDLSNYEVGERFQQTLQHFEQLLGKQPTRVVADAHPGYFSTAIASAVAEKNHAAIKHYWHHEAHFAAVLAENKLWEAPFPVLGFVWDGTGLAPGNKARGGECFLRKNGNTQYLPGWSAFTLLAGDQMAQQPRLSALALSWSIPENAAALKAHFSETEWKFYQNALQHKDRADTNSVGRLFDAVACILGLGARNSFEGQSAMYLEHLASKGQILPENDYANGVFDPVHNTFDSSRIIAKIWTAIRAGRKPEDIALQFHDALALVVKAASEFYGVQDLAFSGGVFQNTLLCDCLIDRLSDTCRLYFHQHLSPNDECISVGQWVLSQTPLLN
jgi:hydrogenase maturation protein HypF